MFLYQREDEEFCGFTIVEGAQEVAVEGLAVGVGDTPITSRAILKRG